MTRRSRLRTCSILISLLASPALGGEPDPPAREARPILTRCVRCHAGDSPAGELDLTTREAALRGGESGAALKPGDAEGSLLYQMVRRRKMPPKKPLDADEVARVRAWIEAGAAWDGPIKAAETPVADGDRWAFRPLAAPAIPTITDPSRAAGPIDAFLLDRLDGAGLALAPTADRRTLIRRA